jgi:hypothetical protein
MKDAILLFSSFIGGLFLGHLAIILAFFVWSFVKVGLGNPKQLAIPVLLVLSIFGTALAYLTGIVLQSGALFLGAAITFAHNAWPLFKHEHGANNQTS